MEEYGYFVSIGYNDESLCDHLGKYSNGIEEYIIPLKRKNTFLILIIDEEVYTDIIEANNITEAIVKRLNDCRPEGVKKFTDISDKRIYDITIRHITNPSEIILD